MNQQALEAAAKVLAKAHGCDLDNIEERSRSSFIDTARAALTAYAEATGDKQKLYDELFAAARGLCEGEDWNSGTHAKTHGYRQKLIDAVNAIKKVGT